MNFTKCDLKYSFSNSVQYRGIYLEDVRKTGKIQGRFVGKIVERLI